MARLQTAKQVAHIPSKPKPKPKQGEVKQNKSHEKHAGHSKLKGKSPSIQNNVKEHDSLREEILALGGDDEDYELLKDVHSDEELSHKRDNKADPSLAKELAKIAKSLDFTSVRPDDAKDESGIENSDDEDEEEEEPEDGSLSETSADLPEEALEKKAEKQKITIPEVAPNSRLLVEPSPQWYMALSPLPSSSTKTAGTSLSPQALSAKQSHASSLHASELSAYERATSANKLAASSPDAAFLQRILSSGTLSDRLSALTLLAQSSPVHNTRALEMLRGMAQKKGREESLKALRAICDWCVGGGLPDRKLKYFIDQPLQHPNATDKHFLVWFFEDWLKKYFYSILQILENLSLDPLPYVRLQAMALIFTLLRDKPEQEQNLLRLLVNKFGDSERSVASRASYHLLQLLQAHPSMKGVVLREVSSLVLRPTRSSAVNTTTTSAGATHLKFTDDAKTSPKPRNKAQDKSEKKDLQQEHSKYYAAITLNQIMLAQTEADRAVAIQLIGLYFELFKEIQGTPEKPVEDGSREASEPVDHSRYAKEKRKKQDQKKGNRKGQDVHDDRFAEVEDSNSRLISAILTGVNRALPFAKLGLEDVGFSKHIDTLFLISHKSTFNISLQALRLIKQICQSLASTPTASTSSSTLFTSITDRYYRTLYTSLQDSRLNTSSKHAMYLNLLLKSLKMDTKAVRVKAFVRRFVQLLVGAGHGGVEFVAGGLYLLGELNKTQPAVRDLLGKSNRVPEGEEESNIYDPKKRDPQYAHADACPMWELTPLLAHYHPTVRLHASQLLLGKDLTASADLSLNTLSHFLDRFVYKNPKKAKSKGPSAMQPGAAAALDGTSIRIVKGAQVGERDVVNDESFWRKDVSQVPVDQVFFHKYFSRKVEKGKAKAEKATKRKGGAESADEEEDEEISDEAEEAGAKSADEGEQENEGESESEGEAEIWKAMQATNPDLHPELDEDDDLSDSASESEESFGSEEDEDAELGSGAGRPDAVDESSDEDEDNLSLAEASDAEDLVDINNIEFPEGLITLDSAASGSESDANSEWGGFNDADKQQKRKRKLGDSKFLKQPQNKKRRRRGRALPTFATYEDYARLIEGQPEDDI